MTQREQGGDPALRMIAGFKLFEALLLVVAGLGALGLVEPDWQRDIVEWLGDLSLREGRRLTSEAALKAGEMLGATSVQRLVGIAIGCFVYAAVFIVEAIGLWRKRRWAEYLTTVVTASLLPFEVMELMQRQSLPKILALVINLLVLVYLIWRLATQKKG